MTSATRQENLPVPAATPAQDDFFDHVRTCNPFDVNRVGASSALQEDAEQVHHRPFMQLLELAGRAHRQQLGVGAMVWGEAGIGKSHLLARLGKWAGPDQRRAVFVYLANLQAEPEQLPRSLLRCVVSILTRGRTRGFYGTPLFRLVNAAIRDALHDEGTRHTWPEAENGYRRLIDDLCDSAPARAAVVDRGAYEVLYRFFRSAYLAGRGADDGVSSRAARWLAGDVLDPHEARSLGLAVRPRREGIALADDEEVKKVLVALAQLAWYRGAPLLLCFDQVDNLEPEQFAALTRFLHALLDSAANLLVVTAGVRATIDRWRTEGVLQESTWHRLGQNEIELQRLGVSEARQIVQARVQPFQEPFLALEPVRELVRKDYLFPLGEAWVQQFLAGRTEVRPRDVINWAREGWHCQQASLQELGGPAWLDGWQVRKPDARRLPELAPEDVQRRIDEKVASKVQEHIRQRRQEPQTLPPDADNLAGLLHALLQRCVNVPPCTSLREVERLQRPRYGQRPPNDLVLHQRFGAHGKDLRTGLLCLAVSNRTSLSGFLRRLVQDPRPPQRLFVVSDERLPLDPGTGGREYLEQLRDRHGGHFHHVVLTFDRYAELDALRAVVGLGRSGDLEIELPDGMTRRLTEREVTESHARCGRYLAHPLLRLLLGGTEAAAAQPVLPPAPVAVNGPTPDDTDLRQFIMGRLAITAELSSQELAVQYQDYLQPKGVQLAPDACRARVEAAVCRLHEDGLVTATAQDDGLHVRGT